MYSDIHPQLKREGLLVNCLGVSVIALSLLVFVVVILLTWHGISSKALERTETAIIIVLAGGLVFALIFISRYFSASYSWNIRQASRILGTSIGEKRKMVYAGAKILHCPIVELFLPGDVVAPGRGEAIRLTVPNWKTPLLGESEVDVYRAVGADDKLVVIRTARDFLFGTPLALSDRHRVIRKRKVMLIGAAAFSLTVLLAVFAYQLWRTANFYQTYVQAGLSQQWPSTEGKMGQAFIRQTEMTSGGKKIPVYEAVLVFDYSVAGNVYKGDRIFFGYQGSAERANAEAVVARYKRYATVRVFYDPENPTISVLEPGHQKDLQGKLWGMGILMTFTVLAMLVATLFCASGIKEVGSAPPSSS